MVCSVNGCDRRPGRLFAIVAGVRRPVCDQHGSPTCWPAAEPRTWQERARAGRLVSKDMTGTVAA